MGIDAKNVSTVCDLKFQEVEQEVTKSGGEVVVSHCGEFSQDFVNSLINDVESMLMDAGEKRSTIKRIFSILVEALQNIRLHGTKNKDGANSSFLVLAKSAKGYFICAGNLLAQEDTAEVRSRLEQIAKTNKEQLKEIYMDVLTNGIMSSKGGAGLGFITIAMKSKSPIQYEIIPIQDANDRALFVMNTWVNQTEA